MSTAASYNATAASNKTNETYNETLESAESDLTMCILHPISGQKRTHSTQHAPHIIPASVFRPVCSHDICSVLSPGLHHLTWRVVEVLLHFPALFEGTLCIVLVSFAPHRCPAPLAAAVHYRLLFAVFSGVGLWVKGGLWWADFFHFSRSSGRCFTVLCPGLSATFWLAFCTALPVLIYCVTILICMPLVEASIGHSAFTPEGVAIVWWGFTIMSSEMGRGCGFVMCLSSCVCVVVFCRIWN